MVPCEDRSEFFEREWRAFCEEHQVEETRKAQHIDFQRIAFFASYLMIQIYGHQIGQDASCYFYEWARKRKLKCSEIKAEERRPGGKLRESPYPSTYRRIFTRLSFRRYTEIAQEILDPARQPILKREPVCSM